MRICGQEITVLDPVEDSQQVREGVYLLVRVVEHRQGRAAECLQVPAEAYPLVQTEDSRLVPVAVYPLDHVEVYLQDPAEAYPLVPVVVFQLAQAADYLQVQALTT